MLDDPEILSSASKEVQKERGDILKRRMETQKLPATSGYIQVAPNQINLSTVGSGRLIGGPNASNEIAAAALSLNTNTGTAGSILDIIEQGRLTLNARREMNENRSTDYEAVMDRMANVKRLTAGVVFHSGYEELCAEVYAEVKRRYSIR